MKQTRKETRRSRVWVVVIFIALLAGLFVPGPAPVAARFPSLPDPASYDLLALQTDGDGTFQSEACGSFAFNLPANWEEGTDVTCGYLVVPEEHGTPSRDTIRLAVVIVKSTNPNPPGDPLVLLQGGPGGSTIDTYTQLIPMSGENLRKNRDLILFDQRGTLYSQPALTCPEMMELNIQYLDVKLSLEESQQKALEALQKCRTRLENQGVNLSAFDSLQNAADVEALRLALGYDKINLYGVSYGTLLALHVMREFPQGLRSVILDSTVPPQENFILDAPRSQNRSFEALFAACAQDAGCNRTYPNLREVFYAEVDRLNKSPVHIQLTDRDTSKNYRALLDGDTLLNTTFQMMYNTEIIPFVPKTIYDVRAGNYDFVERILSIIVFDRTMSEGMYYSTNCAEETNIDPNEFSLEGLPPEIQNLSKNDAKDFLQTCNLWDVDPLDPSVETPVQSDIPTLVLSGEFDPITPPEYGRLAAQTLSRSYFVTFPNGGHGEMLAGECPDAVVIQFLDNPTQKPDTSCAERLGGPKFVTPGSVIHLPVLIKLLNLEGMTGTQTALYLLSLLFLLTALGIYPIVWLVRLLTRSSQTAAPPVYPAGQPAYGDQPGEIGAPQYQAPARKGRGLYRLAPWLSALNGLLLLIFTGLLIATLVTMINENDQRILVGLPGSSRALFVLPVLAAVTTVLMVVAMFTGWFRGAGSVWGRLYFSLLTGAALVCLAILAIWGMLTALFVF